MRLDIHDVVNAVGGKILNNQENTTEILSVSTDTRTIEHGALFIPIKGERFDGHLYIETAAEKGAVCALTEDSTVCRELDIPLIFVESTRRALMDLAYFYRRLFDIKVIAVTGSAGKTTTKDMIAHVMAMKYKTKKTIGNFNNDIGMPLSIFRLEPDDEVLVLEMGMNHAGEISKLSYVGMPDIVVITHIGDAHIENFQNREGILHAKLEILDGLKPGGTVVFNGDDPLLTGDIAQKKASGFNQLYPGADNIISIKNTGITENQCHFRWQGKDINVTVPVPGGHMVMNALLAVVVGIESGVSPDVIAQGFSSFTPPGSRLSLININDMLVIDDVYNANPAAMYEAIKILVGQKSRTVAVLGDMYELGHVAEERHREVGEFAAESGVNLLITIGSHAKLMNEGFLSRAAKNEAEAFHFNKPDDFINESDNILRSGDTVLLKASRGMAFENIIRALKEKA